jgi:hypothetical protein
LEDSRAGHEAEVEATARAKLCLLINVRERHLCACPLIENNWVICNFVVTKVRTILNYHIRQLVSGCLLIAFVFMWAATNATSIGLQCQAARAQLETVPSGLQPMNLTLVGLNGTQVVLNSTDIASLFSVRGLGGFRKVIGNVSSLDNYTGVPLTTLCNIVGGIGNGSVVRITASDNYSQTLSFDEVVDGNFTTYDPITGNVVASTKPLTPIIAYYKNDVNLTSDVGPLMLAIIGPEGLLTPGPFWVRFVMKIEVLSEPVPEFQSFSVTLFLLATAMTAMILLRKRSTTQARQR